MIDNIPIELRKYRQFVCWRYEDLNSVKPTKIPYCPHSGKAANVTNPETWSGFEDAKNAYEIGGYNGIGFVLTENDPFTFIDLDYTEDANEVSRQMNIFEKFDSYSERSPSGKGLHIIINGKIESGRRRSNIEVYSSQRYMTLTGDIFLNKPIADRQKLLSILWEEMGKGSKFVDLETNVEEKYTDEQIVEFAKNASNGEKFTNLYKGAWLEYYPSQSEADFALIDILAFYTQNRNQIIRIFHNSALGVRKKAKRKDYLNWMIGKSFDKLLPPIDLDTINNEFESMKAQQKQVRKIAPDRDVGEASDVPMSTDLTLPRGLMGDLAAYFYNSAVRPVPEIALAAAIGLMSGICGRAFNISNTGLNLYTLLLAPTGTGKEAMKSGINNIFNIITSSLPVVSDFNGPADFASGQALVRHFSNNALGSSLSILGEFHIKLKQFSDPRIAGSTLMLKQMMLDLYHKSGQGQQFNPIVYSDKEKNTKVLYSPSFSILAESTPEKFYEAVDEGNVIEGFLPRFITVEYTGDRVPRNKNHANVKPSNELLNHIFAVISTVITLTQNNHVNEVRMSPEAEQKLDDFDTYCDKRWRDADSEALRGIWNRSHLKALRLAALIAVGCNEKYPVISEEDAIWAINFIHKDTTRLSVRFEKGKIGRQLDESAQTVTLIKSFRDYLLKSYEDCAYKYDKSQAGKIAYNSKIVSYTFLSRKLVSTAPFRLDKLGATAALKRAIQTMIDSGTIAEVPKEQAKKLGCSGRGFVILDQTIMKDE